MPLIHYWESKINDDNKGISLFAQEIVKQLNHTPALTQPITDTDTIHNNGDLIELLMTAAFPPATWESEISGALFPFQGYSFFHTPRFAETLLTDGHYLKKPLNLDAEKMAYFNIRTVYLLILEKFYQIPAPAAEPVIFTVPDYQMGLYRHYHVLMNHTFLDIKINGALPILTEADRNILFQNFRNMEIWMEYIPPALIEVEGFNLLTLVDVTGQEVLSSLRYDLLEKDVLQAQNRFEQLQEKIRILFNKTKLQLGIATFDKRKNTFVSVGHQLNNSSLVQNNDPAGPNAASFKTIYDKLLQEQDPLVMEEVQQAGLPENVINLITRNHIRSLILALLRYNGEVIGILELGSPLPGDLNNFCLTKIEQLLPYFALAVKRHAEEIENRVQSIIKERFTAIHPLLEWRFKEAAQNLLEKQEAGQPAEMEPIIFDEVYPLYGFSDIRGSSVERNKAVQGDLIEHLQLAAKVMQKAIALQPLPILDELRFYVAKTLRKLRRGILSEDEVAILEVVKKQVEPLFAYLEGQNPELQPIIENYRAALDPDLGILYKRRKNYEQSLNLINETLSALMQEEEEKAQKMFPHYFEKYKTDGIEFSIYVGASLVEHHHFDLVFLKNLRLWQLMTLCEMARRSAALKNKLKMPLETTQLLLVYTQPLSIRFRVDERKFDVDGAYNIRYEIVKKRIDKALIAGTGERLTQPGKVVIVYTHAKEAEEYREYIEYLQNKGLVSRHVEYLEVEDLQGVSGLHAIRITVKQQPA